jgi:hypothetical protein
MQRFPQRFWFGRHGSGCAPAASQPAAASSAANDPPRTVRRELNARAKRSKRSDSISLSHSGDRRRAADVAADRPDQRSKRPRIVQSRSRVDVCTTAPARAAIRPATALPWWVKT